LFNKSLWSAKNNYDVVTYVKTDGSLAIGTDIFFHSSSSDSKDYSTRIRQTYDNGSNPWAGVFIEAGVTSPTISTKLMMTVGDYAGDYARILATDSVNASAKLVLGTQGSGANTNSINVNNPDTPGLGSGSGLTYSYNFVTVPIVESWSYHNNGGLKAYTNSALQVGFQMVKGSTSGGFGQVQCPRLTSISLAIVCPIRNSGVVTTAHITSWLGNVVNYYCSYDGTDNVIVQAFGVYS
jgi:hypothetical protein